MCDAFHSYPPLCCFRIGVKRNIERWWRKLLFSHYLLDNHECLCDCLSKCVFLISGYFGIKLRTQKIKKLLEEVLFYSVAIYAVCMLLGAEKLTLKNILKYTILSINNYWFVIVYRKNRIFNFKQRIFRSNYVIANAKCCNGICFISEYIWIRCVTS